MHIEKSGKLLHKLVCLTLIMLSAQAIAHAEQGVVGGFIAGVMHPILGPDHMLAMVAVGLWGAQLKSPAIWILPLTFPMVMACGGLLGIAGIEMPYVEVGISLSALVLGLAVAGNVRAKLWFAMIIVGLFAVFHGHAHGNELPSAVNPLAYGVGFVLSTGLLHLCGVLIGLAIRWPFGSACIRACGGFIALTGGFFLFSSAGLLG